MRVARRAFVVAVLFGVVALPGLVGQAYAQGTWPPPEFSLPDLKGAWVVQVQGEVFFPPPLNGLNGPFIRTGRIVIDGNGGMAIASIANFGGVVETEAYPGICAITKEGLVTITFTDVPIPTLTGIPNEFTFQGYLADGGKRVRLMLSGIKLAGQALPNLGTVLWGELIRQ
jgi:hypothetical protein